MKSEALLRLLIADLVGEAQTRASIATLREDLADLSAQLDAAEARADSLPHRRTYLLLNVSFLRRLLALHEDWIAEVEREFEPGAYAAEARPATKRLTTTCVSGRGSPRPETCEKQVSDLKSDTG